MILRSIKPGKVVLVTNGRFAGKKAVVVKVYDEGTRDRPFAHALIAGIDRYFFDDPRCRYHRDDSHILVISDTDTPSP